jgi:methylmalonyl-CoA mutase N-terminal domain/subunit
VSLQAMAAVLGGAQSLHTNSRDEALSLPTEESVRLALRTQQIIAHETGVPQVTDPLGGSHAIEEMTDRIEREARQYLQRIDAMGGTLQAIENGFIQSEIQNAAYDYQREIETGKRIVVGINKFESEDPQEITTFKLDPAIERQQIERLREVRAGRNARLITDRLQALEMAARGTENLMPHIMSCCEAFATVGEISDRLRGVFGEYEERGA